VRCLADQRIGIWTEKSQKGSSSIEYSSSRALKKTRRKTDTIVRGGAAPVQWPERPHSLCTCQATCMPCRRPPKSPVH